ncbi:MAG TPA: hypothetical protein VF407_22305 [Polyangiaceae bacterium]
MLERLYEAESERAPLLAKVLTPAPAEGGIEQIDLGVLRAFREAHSRVEKIVRELSRLNEDMVDFEGRRN